MEVPSCQGALPTICGSVVMGTSEVPRVWPVSKHLTL